MLRSCCFGWELLVPAAAVVAYSSGTSKHPAPAAFQLCFLLVQAINEVIAKLTT